MSKAINDLLNEHHAILSALQILAAMTGRLREDRAVDENDMRDFISFLKEFADKCHHGKEEGLLFPALVTAGVPDQGGPIGVMLSEHAQGRALIQQMEAAIAGAVDRTQFTRSAEAYASLLQDHIHKENTFLFPTAEQMLTEAQLAQIYDAFEEHEEKVIGQGRHEALHAMLNNLRKKYSA